MTNKKYVIIGLVLLLVVGILALGTPGAVYDSFSINSYGNRLGTKYLTSFVLEQDMLLEKIQIFACGNGTLNIQLLSSGTIAIDKTTELSAPVGDRGEDCYTYVFDDSRVKAGEYQLIVSGTYGERIMTSQDMKPFFRLYGEYKPIESKPVVPSLATETPTLSLLTPSTEVPTTPPTQSLLYLVIILIAIIGIVIYKRR